VGLSHDTRRSLTLHRRCCCCCVCMCVCLCLCVDARDAHSTSRLSNVVVSLFRTCVPRGFHSLFAVAVLLLLCAERLFARAWHRFRRVVTRSR
jgi:hypothetical protein